MFLFFYQLISLAALCLFYFTQNRAALYLPYDGAYLQQLVKLHFEWSSPTTDLILNPLQGLGGITLPINYWFSPSSLVGFLLRGPTPDAVLVYTVVALEFFLATFFLAHALGASRRVAAFASWIGTLVTLPFVVPPYGNKLTLYTFSGHSPWMVEHIAFSAVTIGLLVLLRTAKPARTILYSVLTLLVFVVSLVGYSYSAVLSIPLIAVFFFYALSGKPFTFMGRSLAICFVLGLVILAALPMGYIMALLLNTVPSFFNSELIYGRSSWAFISILFHNMFGLGWLGSLLFIAGIAGGGMAWRRTNGILREVARIYVSYALVLVVTGIMLTFVFRWYRGPSLLYFEIFTWPLIFVFTCFFGEELLRRHGHRLLSLRLKTLFVTGRIAPSVPFALVAPALIFAVLFVVNRPKDMLALPVPPKNTPLSETLISRCALTPGDAWRGSVATFTGFAPPGRNTAWGDNTDYDSTLWKEVGNDHRSIGLWWYGVPTLFAYNQYMSPEYYYLVTRLFASERDVQQRAIVVLTQPDARLLGLFGVRFVVTENELPDEDPAKLIQRYMPWDAFSRGRAKLGRKPPLLLYELDRPNLGNFSPTKQLVEPTAVGMLARLHDPDFQPEQSVVLSEPIEAELVEASDTGFTWGKDGITVRAQSKGQSLLVLPLQYSNCLNITSAASPTDKGPPRLVRADLALTGIVFNDRLDANISYKFGPFSQPLCRVQDYLEVKRLQLGADARSISKEE